MNEWKNEKMKKWKNKRMNEWVLYGLYDEILEIFRNDLFWCLLFRVGEWIKIIIIFFDILMLTKRECQIVLKNN